MTIALKRVNSSTRVIYDTFRKLFIELCEARVQIGFLMYKAGN